MRYLGEAAKAAGRDNNFNLVRLGAAFCVLLSHSFTLSTGNALLEPFRLSAGISLGSMAVLVFFLTSGYLVGGSILSRADPVHFTVSRVLRIFPALIVAMTLTVGIVGPALSSLSPADFWADHQTWRYWLTNCVIVFGNDNQLPGLFNGNPHGSTVNGSLWSISYELWMYGLLVALWAITGGSAHRRRFGAVVAAMVLAALAIYLWKGVWEPSSSEVKSKLSWLIPAFFIGSLLYVARARIPLHGAIAAGALVLLVVAAMIGHRAFALVNLFCFGYLVLYAAYGLPLVRWQLHADYSYGLYLYAFLVQQVLARLVPGIDVLTMTVAATVITLILAAASWHLVEKRALGAVGTVAARLSRRQGRGRLA